MTHSLEGTPGWVVSRKYRDFPLANIEMLPRLAEQGKILPDDYLVNPRLETCVQAREIPELRRIFRRVRLGALGRLLQKLGLAA